MSVIGNTNGGSSSESSRRAYVTVAPFDSYIFTYTTSTSNFVTTGAFSSFTSSGLGNSTTCPKGRILRENGRKLYPGANPSVTQYLVGVYDATTLLNGFIDPNARVFALYTTDKPHYLADSFDSVTGRRDLGPCVITDGDIRTTQGNIYAEVGNAQINTYVSTGTYVSAGTYVFAGSGVGYTTGTGGLVTQLTNKSTSVRLDKLSGEITMNNSTLNAGSTASFVLNNTFIGAGDILILNCPNDTNLNYAIGSGFCVSGSCAIYVRNITGSNLSETPVIKFTIIKSTTA